MKKALFLLLSVIVTAEGAPIRIGSHSEYVTATLPSVVWDKKELDREFTSGLTSHLLVQLVLESVGEPARRLGGVEQPLRVTYDLWKNTFAVSVEGRKPESIPFSALEKVYVYLENLELPVVPIQNLDAQQSFVVRGWLLVEPVSKERSAHIQKWIAENAVIQSGSGTGGGAAGTSGVRFNNLFNALLEQHFTDSNGAKRKVELLSVPFKRRDLN